MKTTLLCVLIAALGAACLQRADRAPPASDTSAVPNSTATPAAPAPAAAPTLPPSPGATKLTVVEGFLTPESVLHDPVQDIYFVSNINGSPTAKDNNGFISRVRPDGAGRTGSRWTPWASGSASCNSADARYWRGSRATRRPA